MTKENREDIVENSTTENEEYAVLEQPIKEKIEWFKDQKIGVIFHWGLYAQAGIVESWQLSKEDSWARKHGAWRNDLQTLRHDYWDLQKEFDPSKFDPEDWAKKARAAGFRYMIFTTKHHDGFNMYDTQYSNYKITGTKAAFSQDQRADVLKHINNAFRQEDIAVGAYYSKADWHSPDYWVPGSDPIGRYASYDPKEDPRRWHAFNQYVEKQLVEICKNYGPIDILWLDGGWVNSEHHEQLDMDRLASKIRQITPDTLIVDRTIGGKYENYVTPERKIPTVPPKKAWESNIPLAKNWGYVPNDIYKEFAEILDSVVQVITLGGNVILGIGPKPDGTLPKEAEKIMLQLGKWLKTFGEAVYNTRGAGNNRIDGLPYTKKGNSRYLFFRKQQAGQKINLKSLLETVNVTELEKNRELIVHDSAIVLPATDYDYGVIKITK